MSLLGQPGRSEHIYIKGNPLKDKSGIRTILILAITLVLQSSIARAFGKSKQAQAKALFKAAYAASEIKVKGSPPFHLKAEFQFYGLNFQHTKGSYEEVWISPDQHRTDFSVPSGSDVIVVSNGQRWQKDPLPYKNTVETIVDATTDLGLGLQYGPPREIKSIQDEASGNRQMTCVVPRRKGYEDEYCFDPQNGRLVWRTELMCGVEYRFSDYEPWGGKWVPRKVDVVQNGSPLVQVAIKSLTPPGTLSPSTFAPPPGAEVEKHVSCRIDELEGGEIIKHVMPKYPESAKRAGYEGRVSFYADIGKQGQLRGLEVVHSLSPDLDAAALQAMSQWRFKPLVCKGVPRENVHRLTLVFRLQ